MNYWHNNPEPNGEVISEGMCYDTEVSHLTSNVAKAAKTRAYSPSGIKGEIRGLERLSQMSWIFLRLSYFLQKQ